MGYVLVFGIPIGGCAVYTALVFWIGRRWGWSNRTLAWLCGAGVPLAVLVWFGAGIAGLWSPIMAIDAQWKIDRLVRTLYVGEPRATIEGRFGTTLSRPDRTDGYGVSGSVAKPGWADHLGQYAFASGGGLCFAMYRGIAVYYDVHDRAKFWRPYGIGDGC